MLKTFKKILVFVNNIGIVVGDKVIRGIGISLIGLTPSHFAPVQSQDLYSQTPCHISY